MLKLYKFFSYIIIPIILINLYLRLINNKEKKKININYKKLEGFLLKPKTWCKIKFNTNHSILMVFCDRKYEFNDYIEKYSLFKKIIKKK